MNAIQAKAPYSFNIDHDGSTYTVTYKLPQFDAKQYFGVFALSALGMIVLCSAVKIDNAASVLLWVVISIGICIWHAFSRKRQFIINDMHVIVGGVSYERSHINKFYIESIKEFYYIRFRYGEKNIRLTGAMRKNSADVLYDRVLEMSGFEIIK